MVTQSVCHYWSSDCSHSAGHNKERAAFGLKSCLLERGRITCWFDRVMRLFDSHQSANVATLID